MMSNTFQLLCEYVTNLVFDGNGNATGDGALENSIDAEVGYHFGFYSRPNDGTAGVVIKPGGKGGSSILFCFRKKQYELSLNKGECAMANDGGAYVKCNSNNVVEINGANYALPKWDSYMTAFNAFVNSLTSVVSPATASGVGTAATAFQAAATADGNNFKSLKAKNG